MDREYPCIPVVPEAGPYASILWLAWMAVTRVFQLIRKE